MVGKLLSDAFKKAKKQSGNSSDHGVAKYLADIMTDDFKSPITTKSMTRYFKGEQSPKKDLRDALAKYLEYENYEDFVLKNSKKGSLKFSKKGIRALILSIVVLVAYFVYSQLINFGKSYMHWIDDHYEEVAAKDTLGKIGVKELDKKLLQEFKKIKVCDTTTFFIEGKPIIWYFKSNNEYEYFTAPGLHPVNGKTLKVVSTEHARIVHDEVKCE
ncbi:hypothetical protein GWK08_13925 [Leptobacterium flavescens]|uniref:Uncharacterized protein n=1 Tax=Leptobacterium flavescens TaxID=472055 RepID=A0A6P0URF5_9FLAO|nr:hypothetical protein [Leptobacterium flavescens]NER14548.1 hypothetical protein [Leptobacterium flavescens]